MSQRPILTLQALSCERDGRALFQPLTLEVAAGDYIELVGANGAGKSTLLRTLAGLHSQYSGLFESVEPLYQGHRLGLDGLQTPLENLAWFAGLEEQDIDTDRLLDSLQTAGVVAKAHDLCGHLSAGQQRRVTMARWMLSRKKLWLLDEPLTALDQTAQSLIQTVIGEYCANGGAVVCATHSAIAMVEKTVLTLQAFDERPNS